MDNKNLDFLFKTLDDAISQNRSDVDALFSKLRDGIDDLESENENGYNNYLYRFHVKKASYLVAVGNLAEYEKEKKLVEKYRLKCHNEEEKNPISMKDKHLREHLLNPIECDVQTNDSTMHSIYELLNGLKQSCNENINTLEQLHSTIMDFTKYTVTSLTELVKLNKIYSSIVTTLNTMRYQIVQDGATSENTNIADKLQIVDDLLGRIESVHHHREVSFAIFVLSYRFSIRSILFADVPLTEERIESRTRQLYTLFHPDKHSNEQKSTFTELFQLISEEKRKLLKELTERASHSSVTEYHEQKGKECWDIAVEYKNAIQKRWDKLRNLKHEVLSKFNDEELKYFQHHFAILSYEQYRAAARHVEYEKSPGISIIKKKLELKKNMALCLYLAGKQMALEAQIYTIAGIYLGTHSGTISPFKDHLDELQRLLKKLHGDDDSLANNRGETHARDGEPELSNALIVYSNSYAGCNQVENAISSELRETILQMCAVRVEEKKISIPRESTLQVKKKGMMSTLKGAGVLTTGVVTGVAIIGEAAADLLAGASIGALFGGPVGAIVGLTVALGSLVGGIALGVFSFRKAEPYFKEPKVRENLNKIMESMLKHYKNQEHSEFLRTLSTPYDSTKEKKKTLINIREVTVGQIYMISLDIKPELIVQELLEHDFNPEGIAYLLLMLGEVLFHAPKLEPRQAPLANVLVETPSLSDFNHNALRVFEEVWINQDLIKKAKKIDNHIKTYVSLGKTVYMEEFVSKTIAYKYSVSKQYISDRIEISVLTRLEELKDAAQINFAICEIIIGGTDNFKKSANIIRELRRKLLTGNNATNMFPMTEIRLQALDDLLTAFGFYEDLSSNADDFNFLKLEGPISMKNIKVVFLESKKSLRCEQVVLFDDDEADGFALLDTILHGILKLDKNKFLNIVRQAFENEEEPIRSGIIDVMRNANLNDLNQWSTYFSGRKHSLTLDLLPILSTMYNMNFELCSVKSHHEYGHAFFSTGEVINFVKNPEMTVTIYVLIGESTDTEDNKSIKGLFVVEYIPLNYVYDQLESVKDFALKANLLNQIAQHDQRKAEEIDESLHLAALESWNSALQFYSKSLECDAKNLAGVLGYVRCMIELHKYTQAENILTKNEKLYSSEFFQCAERWFLLGILRRKMQRYDEAMYAIKEATRLGYNSNTVKNERNLIERLKEQSVTQNFQNYKRMNTLDSQIEENQYNILTIDGGGIRGLVPAVWICELERITGLRSCSMFKMMAGTSTGGIIAAGLSMPDTHERIKPRYSAADLVELYSTQSETIFSDKPLKDRLFSYSYSYSDDGRKRLFDRYFGNTRISQALTELIIPAVYSGKSTSVLFQREIGLINSSKDYKLSDILMCSTAAPTYFTPYSLDGKTYVDGGVHANNPAMIAYSEACRKGVNRDQVLLLSLGTGDYVPDPLHPNADRNFLFWLAHKDSILKVVFDGPQNNIDLQLNGILGSERHHRWQVWLEKPIKLDDTRKETIDYLKELARAQFEEMDAYDSSNRLGKLIERLRGSES